MSGVAPDLPQPVAGIEAIHPYVPGDAAPDADALGLASNENLLGPSPRAIAALRDGLQGLHLYPDASCSALRRQIAATHGLEADDIFCGAGSDELLSLLIRAYSGPGHEVLMPARSFLMAPIQALACGATLVEAERDETGQTLEALIARLSPKTRLVYLANPDNPTGHWLKRDLLADLLARLPRSVLVILDSAYAEYMEDPAYEDGRGLLAAHPNLVMLRTFSKIHGLARLRIGWGVAAPEIVSVIHRIRSPFNVSGPAQLAAIAALEDTAHVERSRDEIRRARTGFLERLAELGLQHGPAPANFVTVRCEGFAGLSAPDVARALRDRQVLVRGVGAYGMADRLRFTIGTCDQMARVAQALAQIRDAGG